MGRARTILCMYETIHVVFCVLYACFPVLRTRLPPHPPYCTARAAFPRYEKQKGDVQKAALLKTLTHYRCKLCKTVCLRLADKRRLDKCPRRNTDNR